MGIKHRKCVYAAVIVIMLVITVVTAVRGVRYHTRAAVSAPEQSRRGLTLIIDAGHGGSDGGAVSPNGTRESEINLDIARKIDLLAAFCGVRTVMTRESELITYSQDSKTIKAQKNEDQQRRINLINNTPGAVLLSIHQNMYTTSAPFGAQVFYAPTSNSEEWAVSMQTMLAENLEPANRRAASRIYSSVLLMNSIDCPAVLVECGFLSNAREEALLNTAEYRTKIAVILAAGYLKEADNFAAAYGL